MSQKNILEREGYELDFNSDNYINGQTKTIFSHQCYRDKCEQWLLDQINTGNDSGGWRVFLCSLQSLANEEHYKLIAELREALSTQEKFTIILS